MYQGYTLKNLTEALNPIRKMEMTIKEPLL